MDVNSIQRRIENDGSIMGEDTARKSAVLIPLIQSADTWAILFEVRSPQLSRQPGDICFPGGRSEKTDSSLRDTAIRETCEELGIPAETVSVIGRLGTCVATPDLFIYPFAGVIDADTKLCPNPEEVSELFTVPLPWLMKQSPEKFTLRLSADADQDFPFERIVSGKNYPFRNREVIEPFYDYRGRTIWGLTARILEHFVSLMNHRIYE
ncbi:CoA pyrophosphatase [Sporolactobacillus sp. THM7-4]|nr:CoA pyrophosphatase [Sporolactobacillus sp. THM7-4]